MPSGDPWASLMLPVGIPSTSTMLSRIAASGSVLLLKVVMVSPDTAVGVHRSGLVPMVQNSTRRLTCLLDAAWARRSAPILRNGDRSSPAPTLPANCLRFSLLMIVAPALAHDCVRHRRWLLG